MEGRMGDCVFCGQPAGWFKDRHPACVERRERGMARLRAIAEGATSRADVDPSAAAVEFGEIRLSHGIAREEAGELAAAVWTEALKRASDDGTVCREEEDRLVAARVAFHLTEADLRGGYARLVQALVLRDLAEQGFTERFQLGDFSAINFQKTERVAWVFSDVDLIEERKRREYVGGSTGYSVRVMKGVYLRQSAFRGRAVDRIENVPTDRGYAAFTDRHLYFAGGRKAWRVAWGKIVSMTPYSDGLGFIRDAANAKPVVLATGDGVFAYNLAQALAERAS
jgi:hypothetical protein